MFALFAFDLRALILVWMVHLQPTGVTHWVATYPETADAIASVCAQEASTYELALRCSAVLVALSWFESRFDPTAEGDEGRSLGLWQIQAGTARSTRTQLLDTRSSAIAASRLVRLSTRICRARPREERLAWYAAGGVGCSSERGFVLSRHRMAIADALLR